MEPSGHCPYLGLKQNRAIRFASPTLEHRCYVSGDASTIPVDQSNYCLSQGHVHCPLYTGSMLPSTQPAPSLVEPLVLPAAGGGIRGWLATLSPRDRAIYSLMVLLLSLIGVLALFLGLQSLLRQPIVDQMPSLPPTAAVAAVATSAPTRAPIGTEAATPSPLPTTPPTVEPTLEPTPANSIILPTDQPAIATEQPAVAASAQPVPSQPQATATAQAAVPTAAPIVAPTVQPAATVLPTQAVITTSLELLTLYFGDPTGALYVPITRQVQVENNQVATAAVRELIAGPQPGLTRLLLPDTKLLGVAVSDGTAIVNFDRRPTGPADVRGYYAVVYTLTQLPAIRQVQFQINGQNIGIAGNGPVVRPVLNPINPDGLPETNSASEFLPLYFPLRNGTNDVRLMRVVPKTKDTAQATLAALLEGPGGYSFAVQTVIPQGTQLRGVSLDPTSRVLIVDFTKEFVAAVNRQAAVRNIVQSLTTLPNIRGVQLLVEDQPLADFWGEEYRNGFGRPQINQE